MQRGTHQTGDVAASDGIAGREPGAELELLLSLSSRISQVERTLAEVRDILRSERPDKEWYTTGEAAQLLGKKEYTVREKWCNQDRIEAEKDPATGRWRIPGREIRRLLNGGSLLPARD